MKLKPLLISTVAASLSSFCFTSCTENTAANTTPEKFQVINPVVMDTSVTNEYVADIHSNKNVELRARISGYLDKIYVDEGAAVKEGQLLFALNPKESESDLAKAKAQAKAAELELKNVKLLFEKNIVSQPEVDLAQSKLDEAKADEERAQLNLSYTQIKAPFDGIINRIPNKVGSLIEEGTLLTSISNNEEMYAYFNVSENDYLDIVAAKDNKSEKKVSLILANGSPYTYNGVIETSESEFDKSTGNLAFRAKFPNPEELLKQGSSGKVVLKKELKSAIIIPQKCVFEVQDKNYVYLVDKNNTVQLRSIVPQYRLSNLYVVESGLSASDKIIYEGLQFVKEGEKISAQTISFDQVSKLLAQL